VRPPFRRKAQILVWQPAKAVAKFPAVPLAEC
jgi:hypothetical protein